MNRRRFLQYTSAGSLAAWLPSTSFALSPAKSAQSYLIASGSTSPLRDMTTYERRASFGWEVAGIPTMDQDGEAELQWSHAGAITSPAKLRLCVLDTREPETPVEVRLRDSGKVIGAFDLRWVGQFQVYEIPLSAEAAAAVLREGIRLKQTKGTLPVWIVTGTGEGPKLPAALTPHLLPEAPSDPMVKFFHRMHSLACIQPFGWMEGCVLDGLQDLSRLPAHAAMRETFLQHLGLFFKDDGQFIYESARGQVHDNRIGGIESMLPWAALAWEKPDHPSIDKLLAACRKKADSDPDGCIQDGGSTTTEGAYTVGYPLAVIARQRKDEVLARTALTQVLVRQQRLFDGRVLSRFARRQKEGPANLGNRNWCRGVTWQFLGMARSLAALDGFTDISAAKAEFVRVAEWIQPFQLDNGLWSVFVDKPNLCPDTSGSAGIAAALAMGVHRGWLPAGSMETARRTLAGLRPHLTQDGFLGGASQSNKGGEGLQRGDYRVIYQMGMGLMAQLVAALDSVES